MKNIIVVVVAVALFGCGAGGTAVKKSPDPDNQEATKARFQSLMERESMGLKPVKAGGNLEITVLAKGKPQAILSNAAKPVQHTLTIPIGTALDVTCYLTDEMSSPAVILKTVFDNIMKVPSIESVSVKTVDADTFKNIGYIYLEAEYLTRDKKYGTAKVLAASTVNMSFYCTHDELGYKKTFLNVTDSVAMSSYVQNFIKEFSGYGRKQIDIASVNNMKVGYAESYQFPGEKNRKKNFAFTTFLIPRSQTDLMAGDSVDTTIYNLSTGALVSGTYYSYENNEAEHEITFEQTGPQQYKVEGVLQGKNFNKTFDSDQPLIYSGFVLDQYSAGKTANKEWNFKEYIPQSPEKPTKSRIVLKESLANGNRMVEYTFHTAKALIEVDGKNYASMNLDMGNLSFLITRKYFDGR